VKHKDSCDCDLEICEFPPTNGRQATSSIHQHQLLEHHEGELDRSEGARKRIGRWKDDKVTSHTTVDSFSIQHHHRGTKKTGIYGSTVLETMQIELRLLSTCTAHFFLMTTMI
jgi:hypothetical protein